MHSIYYEQQKATLALLEEEENYKGSINQY